MHELSIAMSIVDIAESETQKVEADKVDLIILEIGDLAGIEMSAFDFVWPEAIEGSVLENAKMMINKIEGKATCDDCNHTFGLQNLYDVCPKCNSYFKEIIQGQEMRVKTLEVS